MLAGNFTTKCAAALLCIFATALCASASEKWPDPVANDVVPYEGSALTHGPMLGRPTATSMRVWIRTREPMPFTIVHSPELPLTTASPGVEGQTTAEEDNTGYVDLENLEPNTRYFYGVVLDGALIDTRMDYEPGFPHFRTLPDADAYRDEKYNPDGRFNLRFAVTFGNRQTSNIPKYRNPPGYVVFNEQYEDDLDFFIMNGDYIYEEFRTRDNRPHTPDMFRADYKSYLEQSPDMAEFFRHVPTFFTYDDHETYSDLEGTGEIGLGKGKWLYRDVALGPWYEYAGWANFSGPQRQPIRWGEGSYTKDEDILLDANADFSTLRPEAVSTIHVHDGPNAGVYGFVQVVDQHRLRVKPAFQAGATGSYSIGTHHYFDWKPGNCHFFFLDTRGERTRYIPEKALDEDRFLLGATQEHWLTEGVRQTDADFIFVVSSVSWMIYHTNFHVLPDPSNIPPGRSEKEDGFTGAVAERDRLLKVFDGLGKPVLLFTGDLHNAFAVQISDNVWEFMTGPFNSFDHPRATAGNPPYGGWFDSEGTKVKIKWVAGFPNELSYQRLRSKFYGVVQVNNALKSGRPESPGLHWVAYDAPQVVVRIHDAWTGDLVYAEGISTLDAENP
jgi:phosphodiesterase/alkaline phosphatase D-like protein